MLGMQSLSKRGATAIPGAQVIRALIAVSGLRGSHCAKGTSERGENTMCNLSSGRAMLREDLGRWEAVTTIRKAQGWSQPAGMMEEPSGAGMPVL